MPEAAEALELTLAWMALPEALELPERLARAEARLALADRAAEALELLGPQALPEALELPERLARAERPTCGPAASASRRGLTSRLT